MRDATKAKEYLDGLAASGNKLHVHYCIAQNIKDYAQPCTRDRMQGTLVVDFSEAQRNITKGEVTAMFSKYGELCSVRPFNRVRAKFFVQFFDHRKCLAADRAINRTKFCHGIIYIRLAWDYLPDDRQESQVEPSTSSTPKKDPAAHMHKFTGKTLRAPSTSATSNKVSMANGTIAEKRVLVDTQAKETTINPIISSRPNKANDANTDSDNGAQKQEISSVREANNDLMGRMSNLLAMIQASSRSKANY